MRFSSRFVVFNNENRLFPEAVPFFRVVEVSELCARAGAIFNQVLRYIAPILPISNSETMKKPWNAKVASQNLFSETRPILIVNLSLIGIPTNRTYRLLGFEVEKSRIWVLLSYLSEKHAIIMHFWFSASRGNEHCPTTHGCNKSGYSKIASIHRLAIVANDDIRPVS